MSKSRLLQAMLDDAADGRASTHFLPVVYDLDEPLSLNFTRNVCGVTISAYGAVFVPHWATPDPVLKITVAPGGVNVVDLQLLGLRIQGSGAEGNGFDIAGPDNSSWLYNAMFRDLSADGVGGDGFHATGSVFESAFDNCRARDCRGWGATLGSEGTGNFTGVNWSRGSIRKCGGKQADGSIAGGMRWVSGTNDIAVDRVYFVENRGRALDCPNGIGELHRCQFENNCRDDPGAAIRGANWGILNNCTAGANMPGQTGLLGFFCQSHLVLGACGFGASSTVTGSGIVEVSGNDAGLTVNGPRLIRGQP